MSSASVECDYDRIAVARMPEPRGEHPGPLLVFSAVETRDAYKPRHDKQTHKTYVRPDSGNCPHYYFYFMDAELGLVYPWVPTWSPFRLQFHTRIASREIALASRPVGSFG